MKITRKNVLEEMFPVQKFETQKAPLEEEEVLVEEEVTIR